MKFLTFGSIHMPFCATHTSSWYLMRNSLILSFLLNVSSLCVLNFSFFRKWSLSPRHYHKGENTARASPELPSISQNCRRKPHLDPFSVPAQPPAGLLGRVLYGWAWPVPKPCTCSWEWKEPAARLVPPRWPRPPAGPTRRRWGCCRGSC